jgi:hypothetical protein
MISEKFIQALFGDWEDPEFFLQFLGSIGQLKCKCSASDRIQVLQSSTPNIITWENPRLKFQPPDRTDN